ncbi:hypothetical protein JG688_00015005 [Phytophthora aleatoria]|uniref:HAT C-terminal dimerisation domain-containing protein n=1 Tax=Phytophthora aleatoria TaxID=2496075 RepID=A0A8J5IF11_9STRA|nr:hypothetical protein JG688_00015005 [Phytophthora aleatoria]
MFHWMENRFTRTRPSKFDGSPWEYWEYVAEENPKSLLPKLARRVLSIAVNTATCERLFSELGIIHTTKRNRLASDKALDIQTVAQHVRQLAPKHEALNPTMIKAIPAMELMERKRSRYGGSISTRSSQMKKLIRGTRKRRAL